MNEKIKEEFLAKAVAENATIDRIGRRFFDQASLEEERLGADVCNWGFSDIVNYYKMMSSSTIGNILNMNSFFRKYTDYCRSMMLVDDGLNHFSELDFQTIAKSCVNETCMEASIFDEQAIDYLIDNANCNSDKALILSIYEGICGDNKQELLELEPNMLNDTTVSFKSSGRTISISERLRAYLIAAAGEYEVDCYKNDGEMYTTRYHSSDPHCFKMTVKSNPEKPINGNRMFAYRMVKLSEYFGDANINLRNIQRSAQIKAVNDYIKEHRCNAKDAISNKELRERYLLTDKPSAFYTLFGQFIIDID